MKSSTVASIVLFIGAAAAFLLANDFLESQVESPSVPQLRWLEQADPIADATAALASKDHRLVGVYGFHLAVPGVEISQEPAFKQRYGVRPIEGTSDALESEEHARLIELARSYAERYNKHVIAHAVLP